MTAILGLLTLLFPYYSLVVGHPRAPNEEWYYGRPEPGLMTQGGVWPLPANISYLNFNHTLNPTTFQFVSLYNCDILDKARTRYMKLTFPGNVTGSSSGRATLVGLLISVYTPCPPGVPQFEMDESYILSVAPDSSYATLSANEVWGALRGLETFSQLAFYPNDTTIEMRAASVNDRPRFPHRGILYDTSRHFIPVPMLLRNLDLMAQNKFNVFHWHMVDSESFPYDSTTFPNLAAKGAYTPRHIYRQSDVKRVIDFARLRGIRVLAEFDTPGHTGAWGLGQPGLLSDCFHANGLPDLPNLIDPTKNETYTFLSAFFQEVLNVFPDNYIHLGGDEVGGTAINCWWHVIERTTEGLFNYIFRINNPRIRQFMLDHGFRNDTTLLENYYFNRLLSIIQNLNRNTKAVVWQEVLDNKVVAPGVIAHVWKGATYKDMLQEMNDVTKAGHNAIMSSCWYLNYIKYGNDWGYVDKPLKIDRGMYYECDPTGFQGTAAQKERVLGGEAIMFGEYVDATNLLPRLWPRASAVGERLWSDPKQTVSPDAAWPRLHEFRCRMMRRGYPVEPPNLPSYCPLPFDVDYEFD